MRLTLPHKRATAPEAVAARRGAVIHRPAHRLVPGFCEEPTRTKDTENPE